MAVPTGYLPYVTVPALRVNETPAQREARIESAQIERIHAASEEHRRADRFAPARRGRDIDRPHPVAPLEISTEM